ncbi:MAG: hypothetical protein II741_04070 [Lachnospiraceae bacterium]|jgi:hypothetical protein|nr:hypothetical protein [Lachnospiraceae bacterium]
MTEEQKKALKSLYLFVIDLSEKSEKGKEYGRELWDRIVLSEGVLKEVAYYFDTGKFWDGYEVAGFHLTDILVWQVDHFKAYMDRREEMNRYRTERLFLESIEVMLDMEKDPEPFVKKMRDESGTDFDQRVL